METQQTEKSENASAEGSGGSRSLERVVREHLREVQQRLERGKGTWPQPDYVRDETWHGWQGERYALRKALYAANLNPDAP